MSVCFVPPSEWHSGDWNSFASFHSSTSVPAGMLFCVYLARFFEEQVWLQSRFIWFVCVKFLGGSQNSTQSRIVSTYGGWMDDGCMHSKPEHKALPPTAAHAATTNVD